MAKLKDKTKSRIIVISIIAITLVMAMFDYPKYIDAAIDRANQKFNWQLGHVPAIPFRLGLDLQGGTHLVYEADTTAIIEGEKASAVEGVRDVIERRVNAYGVAEPVIQTNKSQGKWRVIVELAGIKNVEEAIAMIGETPLLEFKESNDEPPRDLTNEEQAQLDEHNQQAKDKADDLSKQLRDGADFTELVKNNSDDEYSKETGGALGYIGSSTPGYSQIYKELNESNQVEVNQFFDKTIVDDQGYNLIKVNQIRDGEIEVSANHLLICYLGAQSCESEISREEAEQKINELKQQATPENFTELVKKNSTEPGAEQTGGDLGYFSRGQMIPPFEEAVFSMTVGAISDVVETDFGFHLIYKTDERRQKEYDVSRLLVSTMTAADILPPGDPWKNTELSGKQLKRAQVTFDQVTGEVQVSLEFNPEGSNLFAEITKRNVGKPVAIFLDKEPISVPTVNEAITGGQAVITGNFKIQEAQLLAQRLNAGALPVPIELVGQQTVGASLGAESLARSITAAIIGLILVVIFLLGYYRLPGLLAVIALAVYAIILLFMFKLIAVTLTLAGIAGFILSLGMAVDANVLIFERLKEELRMGKPLGSALEEGFRRAWPSIRDGNFSTLITCFILIWFGTSMIKGFAITLSAGVLVSMFSAIVVTRLLLKSMVNIEKTKKSLFWFGISKKSISNKQ